MRILIIEDDPLFAEILQTFLESNGCKTISAENLETARLQLSCSKFDFVLLDNLLSDGQGINFIEYAKSEVVGAGDVPVIMITSDENQDVMTEAFENGVDDYLVKPLSLDLLWHKIVRVKSNYDKEALLKQQRVDLSNLLNQQEQEELLARHVYEHVAASLTIDREHVNTYLQSSRVFNGDTLFSDIAPNGNMFVFLADATGHGLSAAISIIPLLTTLKAMVSKGMSLAHMLHEANKKLARDLPDDKFVCLIGIEINFHAGTALLFNGGMPDVISISHDHSLQLHKPSNMALGILDPADFDPNIISLETHNLKNLVIYSDGIIEQENSSKQVFGLDRLVSLIKGTKKTDSIISHVINHFTVFNEMEALQDDLSICDIEIDKLVDSHTDNIANEVNNKSGRVIASLHLQGGIIGATDIVGCFDSLMQCIDLNGDMRHKAFTVFAELISNAVDHGVLGLDSKLKNDHAGFAEYIMLKEERLETIKDEDGVDMHFTYCPKIKEIRFSIKDTGSGYEVAKDIKMDDTMLSGRGIPLINQLCKSVEVTPPGNQTSVVL